MGQAKFVADDIHNFFFFFSEKTRLDISCESSAKHEMSRLVFSEKSKKIKEIVVCCSCD